MISFEALTSKANAYTLQQFIDDVSRDTFRINVDSLGITEIVPSLHYNQSAKSKCMCLYAHTIILSCNAVLTATYIVRSDDTLPSKDPVTNKTVLSTMENVAATSGAVATTTVETLPEFDFLISLPNPKTPVFKTTITVNDSLKLPSASDIVFPQNGKNVLAFATRAERTYVDNIGLAKEAVRLERLDSAGISENPSRPTLVNSNATENKFQQLL